MIEEEAHSREGKRTDTCKEVAGPYTNYRFDLGQLDQPDISDDSSESGAADSSSSSCYSSENDEYGDIDNKDMVFEKHHHP